MCAISVITGYKKLAQVIYGMITTIILDLLITIIKKHKKVSSFTLSKTGTPQRNTCMSFIHIRPFGITGHFGVHSTRTLECCLTINMEDYSDSLWVMRYAVPITTSQPSHSSLLPERNKLNSMKQVPSPCCSKCLLAYTVFMCYSVRIC